MSASIDRPPGQFLTPGDDTQPETLEQVAQKFVAMLTADTPFSPEDIKVIQWTFQSIQAHAAMQVARNQPPAAGPPSNATEDFGASPGTEQVQQPGPGAQYAGTQ